MSFRIPFLLGIFASLAISLSAQDTTLTNYRQAYGRLLNIDRCAQRLRVTNPDSFSVDMSVLLIQHQGASILSGDNDQFGTITDLGGAGRYEINRIAAIEGDELILALTPRYNYAVNGTTQVVGVTPLSNARVVASLSPLPFNGEVGGVLFFDVLDTLHLDAALDVDGLGFRGGLGELDPDENCNFLSNRNDYYYGANDDRAARKGEGIAKFISGREAGRGPQANGGGGGNSHNSGGGGGAHRVAAGQGGENQEPDAFGCDGDFPGLSGRALPTTDTLLFFGGGGGAGHANNSSFGGGADGGGIVVIRTSVLRFGPNGRISARGNTAQTLNGDGAGGGGAGGSIRLAYDTLLGTPQLIATGGDGGNVDTNGAKRCQGPGGGGSGGWVGASTLLLNASLAAGAAGEVLESSACIDGNSTPQAGNTGLSVRIEDPIPTGLDSLSADFTFAPAETTVDFSNSTTGPVLSWEWDFGDGSSSEERDPSHTYSEPGTYLVTLTATTACTTATVTREIDLLDRKPTADFSAAPTSGCSPLSVQFTNASTDADTYRWQFPGGMPASSQDTDPQILYTAAGQYDITLIASNEEGSDTLLLTQLIEVASPPSAVFSATATGAFSVSFANTSAFAESYLWDFGNGQTSTAFEPVQTYTASGQYEITLIANSVACEPDTTRQTITVGAPPQAVFTPSATSGCAPLTVSFDNLSTSDFDTIQWSFPGGIPASSTELAPTVTYPAPGNYIAGLRVANALGASETSQTIEVGTATQAAFTFSVSGQTVSFDAGGSVGSDFQWQFGDGTQSSDPNPTHTYPLDTVYLATLIVSSSCGSDTLSQAIDLLPPLPVAAFTAAPTTGCSPFTTQFTATGTGAGTFRWSFPGGDPATSTEVNPSVIYSEPGQYTVTLVVQNTAGSDTLTLTDYLDIGAAPQADFTPVFPGGLTVAFENSSTDATTFAWQFGDGSSGSEAAPEHTYPDCGTYRVRLIASSADCGSDTTFQDIAIEGCPTAAFEQNITSGCAPLAVQFSNSSSGDYSALSWDFPGGEPAFSNDPAPLVIFSQAGSYVVSLTLQSSFGEQSSTQTIQVTAAPAPAFDYTVSGLTLTLINQTPGADSYSWDFGDGSGSNQVSPVHTYATGGLYSVTLNAQAGSCGRAISRNIAIGSTNVQELARAGIRVYPNPVDDRLTVEGFGGGTLQLFASDGRRVRQLVRAGETATLDRAGLPAGWYWLRLIRDREVYGVPLLLR